MAYENLICEIRNRIFYITINRESKLNALNKTTLNELNVVVTDAIKNENIRSILITGAGSKAFIAGADISEFANFNSEEGKVLAKEGQTQVFDLIQNSPKPIIAAINGYALGGGLELALACHIRVASDHAKLGLPEVSLGLIPGYGGTQRLTQLVGKGKALEMILTGDMINAEEALKIGLINHVVSSEQLILKAEQILIKIMSRSLFAVGSAIRAVNASLKENLNGYDIEIEEFSKCFNTSDFKEGVSAFQEKRPPLFKV